jgi:RNA polymerase sigma factor (sigma-70 family)
MTMTGKGVLPVAEASEDEHRARITSLVNDARAGRREAFDGLITEFTPMLWQVARATGLSRPDAEDVVQTAWLNLLSHLDTIHTPAALTSWLVITTKREAWRVRKAGSRQTPEDPEVLILIPDQADGSEERVILADEHEQLRKAFLTLEPRCQELLRIVAFVPRPDYSEMAARLGMARGSVGPTRGRCLEKLRSALGEGGGGQ